MSCDGWPRRGPAICSHAKVTRSASRSWRKSAVGPIAALEPTDLPAILGHVERLAAGTGSDRLELEVPGVNEVAIRHLLGRGFHIDPWINLLMSNRPFGRFDRFIGFSPPIFL